MRAPARSPAADAQVVRPQHRVLSTNGVRLAEVLGIVQISGMSSPIFDFSHLSPEERIQLAEELWDSLTPSDLPLAEELGAELDRRLERHREDPGRGRPAEDVLRDIEQRGR